MSLDQLHSLETETSVAEGHFGFSFLSILYCR